MTDSPLTLARLQALLTRAASCRVAVIGDAMLDIYLHGDADRISPEAPVPVVRVRERTEALGGAANVAQNATAIGCTTVLVGAVGRDLAGSRVAELLAAQGCDTAGLLAVDRPTTTKTRIVARSQQLVRVDEERDDDCSAADIDRLMRAATTAVASSDALILEDYNKGVLVERLIVHCIAEARRKKIPIVVDPKYRNFFSYGGATVFKPNRRELESAVGAAVSLDHPDALPSLVDRLKVDSILLTLSEHGMLLAEGSVEGAAAIHRIPTTARAVYDVVGAGDTVTAYLAAMLAAGATRLEAAVISNYAAGVEVGKAGAATVTPTELLAAFLEHAR